MAVPAETRAWVLELFEGLGDVSARAMFGGLGIYCRGQIFALYSGQQERLFLKASSQLAERLAAEGAEPFEHMRKSGKMARLPYWTLPDTALDDPDEACDWARAALAAANPGFS